MKKEVLSVGKESLRQHPLYPPLTSGKRSVLGQGRQPGFTAYFVDDLQYTLAIRAILHAKFLNQPAIVDQVVARDLLAAGFLVKADLGVRQVLADHIRDLAKADRDTACVVDPVPWPIGHDYPGENLGHLVDMDRAAHRVFEREG